MQSKPETTNSGRSADGEREEARWLAARIASFERESRLTSPWIRGDLRDMVRRLQDVANGR